MVDFCYNRITDLGYDVPVLLSRVWWTEYILYVIWYRMLTYHSQPISIAIK